MSTTPKLFVVTTIQADGSQVIGGIIRQVGKLGGVLLRASAHGVFNGTMRMAQGGKFEHGFLSGFACAERFMLIFVSYGNENIFSRHVTA